MFRSCSDRPSHEFPYNQNIIRLERGKAFVQFWTLPLCAAGLVNVDGFALRPLQGVKLQVGVLVVGRDSGTAYFHAAIFGQIYRTRKALILMGQAVVRKIQILRTI